MESSEKKEFVTRSNASANWKSFQRSKNRERRRMTWISEPRNRLRQGKTVKNARGGRFHRISMARAEKRAPRGEGGSAYASENATGSYRRVSLVFFAKKYCRTEENLEGGSERQAKNVHAGGERENAWKITGRKAITKWPDFEKTFPRSVAHRRNAPTIVSAARNRRPSK